MRARFGRITRVLAVVFVVTGLGAVYAGLGSGHQTTPGSGDNGLVLLAIGVAYLVAGAGLWIEFPWAWWLGGGLSMLVVIGDLVVGIHDGGFVAWSAILALFAASLVRGRRERASRS